MPSTSCGLRFPWRVLSWTHYTIYLLENCLFNSEFAVLLSNFAIRVHATLPLELVCATLPLVFWCHPLYTNCDTHTFSFTFLVHRNDTYAYIFPVSLCRLMVILRIWPSSPNMLGMSIIWRREQTMILTVLWRSSWQLTLPKGWSFALTSGGTFLALSVASITTHSKLFVLYPQVQFATAVLSCHLKERMCVF